MRGEQNLKASGRARWSLACTFAAALMALATATAASAELSTWTLVGTGVAADSGDGGPAREAAINQPRAVSATPNGGYAWAEPWANRVRMVDANGIVTTLAGTGEAGFAGDGGQATAAKLNFVHTAVPTADGGFLLADTKNNRIRKVSSDGIITTVAGTGVHGFSGEGGPATNAQINNPRSVVALPDGGFLFPDSNNNRIRKVSASGKITTVAGTGTRGFGGDGGPATAASLHIPFAVALTGDGGFLIADVDNERIRKVSADGIITTVAGNGVPGFSGDGGPATSASLHNPHNVVALADGGFLIADTSNQRVRRVNADGVITTLIGDGIRGDSGDGGPAASARLNEPKAISVTEGGDLLIADEQNNRIRFVGTVALPRNVTPPAVSGEAAVGTQLTAFAGGWRGTGPLISYQWQRCSVGCENVPGAVAKLYTPTAADIGARLRVAVTASNPAGSVTVASPPTTMIAASLTPKPSPSSPRGAAPAAGDPSPNVPKPGGVNWLVQASRTFQRAAEYTVRGRNTRLADAINAYGKPSCRVISRKHVVATWAGRGIRIDSRANRALPAARTGCSSPTLIHVSEIRLTDRRWVTSLGLRVGDTTSKLRRLYPRSPYVRARPGSSRNQYYLVWRHERCRGSCSPQARRQGVNHPLLTAQVANGKVVALWIPVFGQLR